MSGLNSLVPLPFGIGWPWSAAICQKYLRNWQDHPQAGGDLQKKTVFGWTEHGAINVGKTFLIKKLA